MSRKKIRRNARIKKLKRRIIKLLVINLIIFGSYKIIIYIDTNIKPMVIKISETKVRQMASTAINEAIREDALKNVSYKKLMHFAYDPQGHVASAVPDSIEINKMSTATQLAVQKKLNSLKMKEIKIPLGSILKNQLISNLGPSIKVKLMPMGSVSVDNNIKFTSEGINQTKYDVNLRVKTKIHGYISTMSVSVDVEEEFLVAEAIIVGTPPSTYVNVPSVDGAGNYVAGGSSGSNSTSGNIANGGTGDGAVPPVSSSKK